MFKVFTSIFLLFTTLSYGQLLTEFKASDGLTKAAELAGAEIQNPVLIGIGAANTKKMFPNLSQDASFNLENGNSNGWLYGFMNGQDDAQTTLIPLIKTFGTYLDIRTIVPSLPLDGIEFPALKLEGDYKLADYFMGFLKSKTNYSDLVTAHPEASFTFISLNAMEKEDGTIEEPHWYIYYRDEANNDVFACRMNAINGTDGECKITQTSTSVEKDFNYKRELKLYPQPAGDEIIVSLKEVYNNYKIVDLLGNEYKLNSQLLLNNNLLNVDISNLKRGTYFLILENTNTKDVVKFVKN